MRGLLLILAGFIAVLCYYAILQGPQVSGELLDAAGNPVMNGHVFSIPDWQLGENRIFCWAFAADEAPVGIEGYFRSSATDITYSVQPDGSRDYVLYRGGDGRGSIAARFGNSNIFKILDTKSFPFKVVDLEGKPISGVKVAVVEEKAPRKLSRGFSGGAHLSDYDRTFNSAITDSQGRCAVEASEGMAGTVICSCKGYASTVAEFTKPEKVTEIELQRSARVDGRLLSQNGIPVPDVTLTLEPQDLNTPESQVIDPDLSVSPNYPTQKTDSNGHFSFDGLAQNVYRFQVADLEGQPKHFFDHRDITVAAGQQKVIKLISLPPVHLKGRLVEKGTSQPIPSTLIWISPDDGSEPCYGFDQCNSDSNGYFSLQSPPGNVAITSQDLSASKRLAVSPVKNAFILLEGEERQEGNTQNTVIRGVVLGKTGSPVSGAQVHLIDDGNGALVHLQTVRTDSKGHFFCKYKFAPLVRVSAERGSYGTLTWLTVKRGATVKLRLTPNCVGKVTGVVYNLEKNPAANLRVSIDCTADGFDFGSETKTDSSGRFSFSGLLPGHYLVSSLEPNGPDFQENITLKRGETKAVVCNFMEPFPASFDGIVENADGKPLADAVLQTSPGTPAEGPQLVTDSAGRFKIHRREPSVDDYLSVRYGERQVAFAYHKNGIYRLPKADRKP